MSCFSDTTRGPKRKNCFSKGWVFLSFWFLSWVFKSSSSYKLVTGTGYINWLPQEQQQQELHWSLSNCLSLRKAVKHYNFTMFSSKYLYQFRKHLLIKMAQFQGKREPKQDSRIIWPHNRGQNVLETCTQNNMKFDDVPVVWRIHFQIKSVHWNRQCLKVELICQCIVSVSADILPRRVKQLLTI